MLALVGGFALEFRRDRRRQIGAARLVMAEFGRSMIEIVAVRERPSSQRSTSDEGKVYLEGPHPNISAVTWTENAAEFVATLNRAQFDEVEEAAAGLQLAGEWGFLEDSVDTTWALVSRAQAIIGPLGEPTWVDRYLWRL